MPGPRPLNHESKKAGMAACNRNPRAGFTLIEVTLVIVIIGILLSVVAPRFPELGSSRLKSTTRRLAAQISYLYDEAALRGRVYRLRADLDRDFYTVSVFLPFEQTGQQDRTASAEPADSDSSVGEDPGFRQVWDPYSEPLQFPAGVEFDSFAGAEGTSYSGLADLYFLPEGGFGEWSFDVVADNGERKHIAINMMNGKVTVSGLENGNG